MNFSLITSQLQMMRDHTLLILDRNDCGVHSLVQQVVLDTINEIDIIWTDEFNSLNTLQAYLSTTYDILRDQQLLQGKQLVTRVLFNNNYHDKDKTWDLVYMSHKQMENSYILNMIDQLHCSQDLINYLFATSTSKFKPLINSSDETDANKYTIAAVGGTFDNLHDGHKILLSIASFVTADKLIIGITGESLLQNKKYKEFLQPFDKRSEVVKQFMSFVSPDLAIEIHEINDICGPTLNIKEIEALILSEETSAGGEYINKIRLEKNFPLLSLHKIDVIGGGSKDDNWADKLSSTKIRELQFLNSQK